MILYNSLVFRDKETTMNTQGPSNTNRGNTHNTFWHEDQVVLSFYFEEELTESNKTAMYEKLHQYRINLNNFLVSHGFKLDFLRGESPPNGEASIPQSKLSVGSHTRGVHLFGLQTHLKPAVSMPKQARQIQTGVISVFQLGKADNAEPDTAGSISAGSVPDIVNLINDRLEILNSTEG